MSRADELRSELAEIEAALFRAMQERDEQATLDAAFTRACIRAQIRQASQCPK